MIMIIRNELFILFFGFCFCFCFLFFVFCLIFFYPLEDVPNHRPLRLEYLKLEPPNIPLRVFITAIEIGIGIRGVEAKNWGLQSLLLGILNYL